MSRRWRKVPGFARPSTLSDKCHVMGDDERVRTNRLALRQTLAARFSPIADFGNRNEGTNPKIFRTRKGSILNARNLSRIRSLEPRRMHAILRFLRAAAKAVERPNGRTPWAAKGTAWRDDKRRSPVPPASPRGRRARIPAHHGVLRKSKARLDGAAAQTSGRCAGVQSSARGESAMVRCARAQSSPCPA